MNLDEHLDHLERAAMIAARIAAMVRDDALMLRPSFGSVEQRTEWATLQRDALAYGAEVEAYKP